VTSNLIGRQLKKLQGDISKTKHGMDGLFFLPVGSSDQFVHLGSTLIWFSNVQIICFWV